MSDKVKIIDKGTQQVLFTCSIEEREKAYKYASELEEMGLDIELIAPGLPQTLANSLKASEEEQERLQEELQDEIGSHTSCCFEQEQDPSST